MPCCKPAPKQTATPPMDGRAKPAIPAGRCHCGSHDEGGDATQRNQAQQDRQCCGADGGSDQEKR